MSNPFFILHALGDDPIVEKVPDMHIKSGVAYIVSSKDYTISKTEEQFNQRVKELEEENFNLREKISSIYKILNPEEEEYND